jgi:hypothetical protein
MPTWKKPSGRSPKFKGFGKINGDSGYNFILTVIDGPLSELGPLLLRKGAQPISFSSE